MLDNLDYEDEQKLLNAIVQVGSFCNYMEINWWDLGREQNADIRSVGEALSSIPDVSLSLDNIAQALSDIAANVGS